MGFGYKAENSHYIKGENNILFYTGNQASASIPSYFKNSKTINPMISLTGTQTTMEFGNFGNLTSNVSIKLSNNSPILYTQPKESITPNRDLLGRIRGASTTPGAFNY